MAAAERGMRKNYQPGDRLAKAGVMLLDPNPQTRDQPSQLMMLQRADGDSGPHKPALGRHCGDGQRSARGALDIRQERRTTCGPRNWSSTTDALKQVLDPMHAFRLERPAKLIDPPAEIDSFLQFEIFK